MPEYLSQHESLIFAEGFCFFIPALVWNGQEMALNRVQKMTQTWMHIQIITTALKYSHIAKTNEKQYIEKEGSDWL